MAAIFSDTKFFLKNVLVNLQTLLTLQTLLVKNFIEITLSRTVFEIQAFLCFPYLENW